MRTLLRTLALAASLLIPMTPSIAADASTKAAGRGKLVHMVSFKFKETSSSADIQKVEEAFAALPDKIPQIASYETGTNVSPEKLDKGFTHAFLLTFHSAKDRDEYLVHPDHKEFGKIVGPHLADVFVIDFWAAKSGAAKGAKREKPAKDKPGKARKARSE